LQSRRDAAMHGLSVPDAVLAEIRSLAESHAISV
jgi:hypothetical protein